MVLVDYVLETATAAGMTAWKEHIISAKEKQELSNRINQYLNQQKKYNGIYSIEEEYDFQGIYEYINSNLHSKLITAVSGTERQRTAARRDLYSGAYTAAGAKTVESKEKVRRLISCFVDITRDYLRGKISLSDRFIAADIEDSINAHTDSALKDFESRIEQKQAEPGIVSIQEISDLAGNGKYSEIEKYAQTAMNMIGATHPLYPTYRFELDAKNQMRSVPNNDQAKQKYPPRLVGSGTILLGGKPVTEFSPDLIDYADRHQLPITMQISDAKKYLGDIEDPFQHEAEALIGQKFIRQPKEFEPPKPYSIQINGKDIIPYIELGLEEIDDDGTLIISNKGQTSPLLRIRIEINAQLGKHRININPNDNSNESRLCFRKFVKASLNRSEIIIYSLSLNEPLLSGNFCRDSDCDYTQIDQEIDLLERVSQIEHYCGKTLELPDSITNGDYHAIWYASELIRGHATSGKSDIFSFEGVLSEDFRERIRHASNKPSNYAFISTATIHIFSCTFSLPVLREFPNAHIHELEKVKQLVELLNIGNSIPFSLESETKEYIDRMAPSEQVTSSDMRHLLCASAIGQTTNS